MFDQAKVSILYFIGEINRRNEIQLTHFIGQFIVPRMILFKVSIFSDLENTYTFITRDWI